MESVLSSHRSHSFETSITCGMFAVTADTYICSVVVLPFLSFL